MKLDETDKKILERLQTNADITNAQLASELNISPAGMLDRVKRLENSGIIRRYVALVDADKVGKGMWAFTSVSLSVHQLNSLENFKEEVKKLSEVLECYYVAGEEDYILKVALKDMREYEEFLLHKLTKIQGVNKIKTTFVLSSVKFDTKIDIEVNKD
ncbi:MAG: Lrp/AsnC family transcriptional regulator [Ignavibacteria bacterium]|jgi:DNA-binding Lrp family transcriptional regulator|nr:Lrp/AsnC family transcriptional regulator [Ignavibacteria bacterium]MCU7501834.1 Lrp/AsnC family transcriptional regulator [Ignavibacteria bacterium]MCU7514820.1 Lrp/AsnC family transcriptional regulator [Ignavibacteria bacterium]